MLQRTLRAVLGRHQFPSSDPREPRTDSAVEIGRKGRASCGSSGAGQVFGVRHGSNPCSGEADPLRQERQPRGGPVYLFQRGRFFVSVVVVVGLVVLVGLRFGVLDLAESATDEVFQPSVIVLAIVLEISRKLRLIGRAIGL